MSWLFSAAATPPSPPPEQGLALLPTDVAADVGADGLANALFPAPSSPAATQYYLMIFLLTLFLGPVFAPSSAVDFVLRGWLVHWALPALLCLLVALFDTSLELTRQTLQPEARVARAKSQRNLYLTLLNIVLTIAISRIYILLHSRKASAEVVTGSELARASSESALHHARAEFEQAQAAREAAEVAQKAAEAERDRLSKLLLAALAQPPGSGGASGASDSSAEAFEDLSRSELVHFWSSDDTGAEQQPQRAEAENEEGVPPIPTNQTRQR